MPLLGERLGGRGGTEDTSKRNLLRVRSFRSAFTEFEQVLPSLMETQPALLTKLYSDCQSFAETEIKSLLERSDSPPRQNDEPL